MSDEIELKLEVAPEAADWLLGDRLRLKRSRRRTLRQLSVYYDTPDFALRKSGYSLRVRRIGKRKHFVQTLKSLDGGAGMFDRGEWECDIDGPEPELEQLDGTPAAALKIDQLEPVVRTEVDRTMCRIERDESELELDIDQGLVSAAEREMPISEVEIELVSGKPRAAIDLAQRVAEEIPVRLSVLSKAERGFALADGGLPKATKAEPVKLDRAMSVTEGFETIVSACLRHFRLNEPLVIESREVEGLHQARVAMRRLRSAFSLFKPVIRDPELKRIKKELSWFTAELGDARNLDVYLERDLSTDQRHFIEERREKAYDNAIAAIDSRRFRRLMLDLAGWAAAGEWRDKGRAARPVRPFVSRRIDRLWSKVCDSGDVSQLGDQQRHHLRIEMKKLRYGLAFADALHKSRRKKKFTKTIKQVQESLGLLHDAVVCRSLVTLNSWIMAPGQTKGEKRLVRDADRALHQLRKIGPYWG